MEKALTARDKNDIFWIKKRRYMVSSDVKSKAERGYFNPDMVAEIRSAYDRYDNGTELFELTGSEFMDHPTTASGQIAYAKSIAKMMHTLELLENTQETQKQDPTEAFFTEIKDDAKVLIRETIDAFFMGCGVDKDGSEFRDKKKKEVAQEEFYDKRKEYEILIKTEKRIAGSEMIDIIRESSGIDERIKTDETGDDEVLVKLIKENDTEAVKHADKIESLRMISHDAIIEAAEINAGRDALWQAVKKNIDEENKTDLAKKIIQEAFEAYSFDVDMNLRRLLYKKEAVYYLIRWILTKEPVDEIIAARIAEISDEKPDVYDAASKISQITGYVKPTESKFEIKDAGSDWESIFKVGKEVQNYLYSHPTQFESQSLLSVTTDINELTDILSKACAITKEADRITISGEFVKAPADRRQNLFDLWVKCNTLCRIGYSITEIIIDKEDRTIGEATGTLKGMLPMLSFFAKEKVDRAAFSQVIRERSDLIVY